MNQELRKTVPIRLTPTIAALVIALGVPIAAENAAAVDSAGEVWLISTRHAPRAGEVTSAEKRIRYWRLQDGHWWKPADGEHFVEAEEPPVPTAIFIHGNRTDHSGAVRDGWRVYRRMKQEAAGRPFRFVIWSWPSDRIRGRNRQDVRVKAAYSDVQGYYLARCLEQVNPDTPVSLIGYSFGARVITAALHLLAGGQIAERCLSEPAETHSPDAAGKPIRAVLVAAALDADWLMPGRRNGLALSQVDGMLVTENGCDPVLKWYPLMYCRGGPQALGYCGPACGWGSERLELLGVSCAVGRAHDWGSYMRSPGLLGRLGWYTFLGSPPPPAAPEGPGFPEVPSDAE